MLLFFLLSIIPTKFSTSILIKVVVVSFVIFILTKLLHELYPFYVAIAAFLFLIIYFAFVISKQPDFNKKINSRLPMSSGEIESSAERKNVTVSSLGIKAGSDQAFGRLDQESIDAIIKATSDDSHTSELIEENKEVIEKDEEKPLAPDSQQTSKEDTTNEIEIVDLLAPKDDLNYNVEHPSTHEPEMAETELTNEIENAIDQFMKDELQLNDKVNKHDQNKEDEVDTSNDLENSESSNDELFDLGTAHDEEVLGEIFEGSMRKILIEEDSRDKVDDQNQELLLIDRRLIDEVDEVNEKQLETDVKFIEQTPKKQDKENLDAGDNVQEKKESILKKRSKLFEQLEKDL